MLLTSTRLGLLMSAFALSGCGSALFGGGAVGYDSQGCVEGGLRRAQDPELVREAMATFDLACQSGDASACSAMGVIFETGVAAPADGPRAHQYFVRACTAGNQRGCVNKAMLELDGARWGTPPDKTAIAHARNTLLTACEKGEASGCSHMGKLMVKNDKNPIDRASGQTMLERACEANDADACFELAELVPTSERPAQETLELYVKACVAGHEPACRRLSSEPERVAIR